MKKELSISSIAKICLKEKKKGKKIVHCHGTFDLLHIGHIKHFHEAKKFGDKLVVTITADKNINKGPGRPAFNQTNRLQAIAALEVVDYVGIDNNPTAEKVIKEIKPNIYCKGPDYKNHNNDITQEIKNEIKTLKSIGGKIVYTQSEAFSSSKLINSFVNNDSRLKKTTLSKIRKNFSFDEVKNFVNNFGKLNVLVIGEVILDQYIFCEALGKSGKEPVLVLKELKNERYLGGAGAICRHLSTFCKKITLLSMLGEKKEFIGEIKKDLPKNIDFKYIKKTGSPTITKKRFIDNLSLHKILGVDNLNDEFLNNKDEKILINLLKKNLPYYDLVLVSDYGHGFLSKKSANLISKYSKYLAINAQVNAANIGYHSMNKYKNIDCLIVNEKELRHEMRDKRNKIEYLMKKYSKKQSIKDIVVTQGVTGALLYDKKKNQFKHCEAFAKSAIDKVGAGDAMLSLMSLCLKSKLDKNLSMLISSLGAAQAVKSIGNKDALEKTKILKAISHLIIK